MLNSGSSVQVVNVVMSPTNNGGSENDMDEKVDDKGDMNKSHGSRGFKKPSCSSSRGRVKIEDHDSFFTGKSFYDCPG